MPISSRVTLAVAMFAGLLLAGCAPHRATRPPAATTAASAATRAAATHATRTHAQHGTNQASANSNTGDADMPARTGIAACDDYLSSYLACHQAAHIFAPDQLQSRYEAMRTSLLRDSRNPDIRPQLSERCNSLARSLRQALHGKSCATSPPPATSSP
ncbi:MAG TPA: hypothetical protein VGN24_01950 [Rhodanobacter sp.]|jgi:hypothetical protein|nr:hypothetical protein [Rhodanobacter sp.]